MPKSMLTTTHKWVTSINPINTRLNIFFFPYAGGGTSMFHQWQNYLPEGVGTNFVHLPGREMRLKEPLYMQLDPLIEELSQVLLPYMELPYVFFGHSMGALISFELARALRRKKLQAPVHLLLSAHKAPHLQRNREMFYKLNDANLLQKMKQYASLPEEVLHNKELLQIFLPILRADFTMCETYKYQVEEAVECPISVFGGSEDGYVSFEDLMAWKIHTTGPFSAYMFPGDHLFLQSAKQLLVSALSQELTKIARNLPSLHSGETSGKA